jgi:chromosome condensin MukBEF ATPase and DNA-binding subunit MukB
MLSNLSNGVHVQDKITINLSAKNQYDKAYKSIVPVTGITAVQAARECSTIIIAIRS